MSYDYITTRGEEISKWYTAKNKTGELEKWRRALDNPDESVRQHLIPLLDPSTVATLPRHSAILSVAFTLAKPYISKDNSEFDILDNPLRKEWVFKTPEVASTSWKGAFGAALFRLGRPRTDPAVVRLLGDARDNAEEGDESGPEGTAGALTFFPTFFDPGQMALELINPHDRQRNKGKAPVPLECVSIGARGVLTIVYLPPPVTTPEVWGRDLALLAEGVVAMLTVYGFGAKTSSGFGLAARRFEGSVLAIHALLTPIASPATVPDEKKPFLDAEGNLLDDLRWTDGSLVIREEFARRRKEKTGRYGKEDTTLYKQAEKWWKERPAPAASTTTGKAGQFYFATAEELNHIVAEAAVQMMAQGGEE